MTRVMIRVDVMNKGVECIAFTWICTKSFRFLRPMDELLSFKSYYANEPRSLTKVMKISSLHCCGPLSVDKGVLTPVSRITI